MTNAVKSSTTLTDRSNLLSRLVRALQRRGNRIVDLIDGGARQKQQAVKKAQQRQAWGETAQAQFQANAAELLCNQQIRSMLEEIIAARTGRPVRHVRSEILMKIADTGFRAHACRRAYTKHWFEVKGPIDEKLAPLVDTDGLLVVFVKSGSKLGLCPPLELILSEQRGNGFRAPYFFGSFTVSGLKLGVWEAIESKRIPFTRYSLADQIRVIEAIAAANVVRAERTVPVLTRWVDFDLRKFNSRFRFMNKTADSQWKELYTRTADVMRHHRTLVQRLRPGDGTFLTHNDISANNIFVPPNGDVLLFDWEMSTLSVPGADLGVLARAGADSDLVSCYVSRMAQYGVELNTDTVRFTLDVVEGFRSLHRGWRKQSTEEAEIGLALLTRHLQSHCHSRLGAALPSPIPPL